MNVDSILVSVQALYVNLYQYLLIYLFNLHPSLFIYIILCPVTKLYSCLFYRVGMMRSLTSVESSKLELIWHK